MTSLNVGRFDAPGTGTEMSGLGCRVFCGSVIVGFFMPVVLCGMNKLAISTNGSLLLLLLLLMLLLWLWLLLLVAAVAVCHHPASLYKARWSESSPAADAASVSCFRLLS